jgi:hypothetical protein
MGLALWTTSAEGGLIAFGSRGYIQCFRRDLTVGLNTNTGTGTNINREKLPFSHLSMSFT